MADILGRVRMDLRDGFDDHLSRVGRDVYLIRLLHTYGPEAGGVYESERDTVYDELLERLEVDFGALCDVLVSMRKLSSKID